MGHVLYYWRDGHAKPGRTSLTPYVPICALFETLSGLSSVQSTLLTCRLMLDFFSIVCLTRVS
jgi:hypothetical protein